MKALLMFILLFCVGGFVAAQEPGVDELLQGFEENTPGSEVDALMDGFDQGQLQLEKPQEEVKPSWLSLDGYVSSSLAYSYQHADPKPGEGDFTGFSRARLKWFPEANMKFPGKWRSKISASVYYDAAYQLHDRDAYPQRFLDDYEHELELREAWISTPLGKHYELKLGRQFMLWGKSDSIRVVDVLNPLDMREPGIVDLEDLRLPVSMVRLDYYRGNWNVNWVLIPEILPNKMPVYGSDYYPALNPAPPQQRPESWSDYEVGMAINGTFSGWDLSFHLAQYYEDQAHFVFVGPPNVLERHYAQLKLFGVAGNVVMGSFLLKSELAQIRGLEYFSLPGEALNRYDWMLGVEYSGINNHTLAVEALAQYLPEHDQKLKQEFVDENSYQLAIRATGNYLRETLQVMALVMGFGTDKDIGGIYRLQAKYIPYDAVSVTLGVLAYQSGESPLLQAIADNDRVFAELRWDY